MRNSILRATVEHVEPRRLLASAISSGNSVSSNIGAVGEADEYTIGAAAGAAFVVALRDSSNSSSFAPRLQVVAPNGQTVVNKTHASGMTVVVPTGSNGTYLIRVLDDGQDKTGAYTLTAFTPGAVPNDGDLATVNSGQRYANPITQGDVDFYKIDANVGEQLSVTVSRNSGADSVDPTVVFLSPVGEIIGSPSSNTGVRVEYRALTAGTYYSVVTDAGNDESGLLAVTHTRLPGAQYTGDPDTAPLASGVARQGNMPEGDVDVWSAFIAAGVTVTATMTSSGGSLLEPDLLFFGPDGTQLVRALPSGNGSAFVATFTTTVANTGRYYFVGRDYEVDDGGTFAFQYNLSAGNGLSPVVNGVLNVAGTSAADRIKIRTSGSNVIVEINGVSETYARNTINRIELYSGDGADNIDMRQTDVPAYVSAGSGDDSVSGGSGNDSLTGGGGRNRLFGGEGNDRLNGSGGRDFLYGEGGDDRLYGQDGNDYLDGGGNRDRVYAGDGDDLLIGGSSNDRLYGNGGNDTLNGGPGNDNLDGSTGNDLVLNKEPGDLLISIESS